MRNLLFFLGDLSTMAVADGYGVDLIVPGCVQIFNRDWFIVVFVLP